MSATFKSLGEKLNEACFQLINNDPFCTLCNVKLPSKSNYDSHMKAKSHRAKSNNVFKQLMTLVLSPGITMKKNDTEDVDIYCILCEQQVSNVFDISFHNHINDCGHKTKVNQQMNMQRAKKLDAFLKRQFDGPQDVLLKGVTRAAIIIVDEWYRCIACDCELTNWSHLCMHIKEISHQEWAFDQLLKVADKVGLSLGIIIKGGSLVCKLCDCQFGNGLATADAYFHAHSTAADDEHKKKVQKQIEDGLYEYLKDEDIPETDSIALPNNMMNGFDGNVEAYAMLAFYRPNRNRNEYIIYAHFGLALY